MKNCPLIPMGAITGKPGRKQLREHLAKYMSVGINRFMIYPRSGLELEYMGKEWLEVCRHIIECAEEHGMEIWIYDEYNWPSGTCAGRVIRRNPDFACKKITVFADCSINRKTNRDYFWNVSSIPLYADVLSPEAADCFLALTHEKYAAVFSSYFGKTIKGFFTDEPSPMYAAACHKTPGSLLDIPYYHGLEEDYHALSGGSFRSDVEAHLEGKTPAGLWPRYFQLTGQRFTGTFMNRIRDWCTRHGLLFTGHLMDESVPRKALMANGDPMLAMNSFTMPGMDEIFTHTVPDKIEWVTLKMLENAVIRSKGNGGMAELFALGPADMPLAVMRQMIWLCALHGVDHYLLAVAALDARGNIEKPYYYNPLTYTQPRFGFFRELGDEASTAAVFAAKETLCNIAVRYPQSLTAAAAMTDSGDTRQPGLPALLKDLSQAQWPSRLVPENCGRTDSYRAVLSLLADGVREEVSGRLFKSNTELLDWLERNVPRNALVKNKDGRREENLLVKTFMDGSVCILSLSDRNRHGLTLTLTGRKPVSFVLPGRGVFLWPEENRPAIQRGKILALPDEDYPVELLSPNTMRCIFTGAGRCEFVLEYGLEELEIFLRNYGERPEIILDGKKITAAADCRGLPDGLNELYKTSGKLSLRRGKHVLELKNGAADSTYLPLAFISGSFALTEGNVLKSLPDSLKISAFRKHGLNEYTGKLAFSITASLSAATHLKLNSGGMPTEIFISGESIGRRAWTPFIWEIPPHLRKEKTDISVVISTSIKPLFGKTARGIV